MSFRVSDRVTPVIDTTYTVLVQTGRLTQSKPESPAAAWYAFYLSQTICTLCKWFGKRWFNSDLLEKKWLGEPLFFQKGCPVPPCLRPNALPCQGPRKSCC